MKKLLSKCAICLMLMGIFAMPAKAGTHTLEYEVRSVPAYVQTYEIMGVEFAYVYYLDGSYAMFINGVECWRHMNWQSA